MTDATLTRGQRQTQKARESYAARFTSPEEKVKHYQELGRLAADRRLVLSGDEKEALKAASASLGEAYALLQKIAQRVECNPENQPDQAA